MGLITIESLEEEYGSRNAVLEAYIDGTIPEDSIKHRIIQSRYSPMAIAEVSNRIMMRRMDELSRKIDRIGVWFEGKNWIENLCGIRAPGTGVTSWACDLPVGHAGDHSNGTLGRHCQWNNHEFTKRHSGE